MKRIFPLYIVIFIGFLGFAMTVPLFTSMFLHPTESWFPDYYTKGQRSILLGAILAMYPLGQFFGSPVLGAISDRFGRKKILLISLCITMVAYFFIALFLQIFSLTLVYIALFIAGFFEGNVTIAQSAIADITSPENKNHRFGYIYLSASLAFVAGPLMGGFLADNELVSWFTYATPFWLVFLLFIPLILWIAKCFEETHPEEKRLPISYFQALTNIRHIFLDVKLRPYYLVNFFLYLSIFGYFRVYPMYLVDMYSFNVRVLSEYVAWVSVPIIIVNGILLRPLSKIWSPKAMTIVSGILMAVGMITVLLFKGISSLWITLFIATFFVAICMPSSATTISNEAEHQGEAMGNNQSLQVGSQAIAGFIGGLLAALFIEFPLIVCAACGLIGGVLLFMLRPAENLEQ
ncbi:MAG: MFS transporter [Simkaniaceae bacterium]|nr:MFS transporter [Simkaniaceae bacterium]